MSYETDGSLERQMSAFDAHPPAPAQRKPDWAKWHECARELAEHDDRLRRIAAQRAAAEAADDTPKLEPPAVTPPAVEATIEAMTEPTAEPRKVQTMAKFHVRWQESDHGHGRMPYCHSDPSIAVELEFPEGTPRETIRAQIAATLELIRTELVAQVIKARPPAPAPREADEVDDQARRSTQAHGAAHEAMVGGDDYGDLADDEPPRRTEYDPRRDNQAPRERHYADHPPRDERPREDRRDDRGGQRRGSGGNKPWTEVDRLPERAKQLWGYAQDFGAVGWFKAWAKRNRCPGTFNDWDDRAVVDAVDDYVRAGRPADPARDDSRSNGYAGANGRN